MLALPTVRGSKVYCVVQQVTQRVVISRGNVKVPELPVQLAVACMAIVLWGTNATGGRSVFSTNSGVCRNNKSPLCKFTPVSLFAPVDSKLLCVLSVFLTNMKK